MTSQERRCNSPFKVKGGAVAAIYGYSLVGFTELLCSFLNPVVISEDCTKTEI